MARGRLKIAALAIAIGFLTVTHLQAVGPSVTLAWDPSTSSTVVGYNIYYGQASRSYGTPISVGNVTNATVSSLTMGATYYFAATALDTNGLESDYSAEVVYTVASNAVPVITLSSPADGSSYVAPATINLAANVVTNGHTINSVQFFNGTNLIGQVANQPYAYSWNNVGAGNYSLGAQVVYDGGSILASSNVNVTVALQAPSVALTSPTDGSSYLAPATISLAANVVTNGHTINSVQFYNGSTLIGQVTNQPYAFTWGNVGAGSYSLSANAIYDGGSSVGSSSVNVSVALAAPAVALISPNDGASFAAPANITLSAAITNSGHTINAVQFFNGTNLVGAVTNAPYDFGWTNVGVGSYTLTAQALYDGSSSAQSAPSHISVWSLPPPWQTADIGNTAMAGSAIYSNGLFTVQGAGAIGGHSDEFRFVYQPLSGDGQVLAQIQPGQTSGAAGVMIREALTDASTYTYLGLTANNSFKWQRRSSTGGRSYSLKTGGPVPPVWVRLGRTNNVFSSYNSADGTNWNFIGSTTISMAPSVYIGLAVASGQTNVLNTAQFGSVEVDLSNIAVATLSPTQQ